MFWPRSESKPRSREQPNENTCDPDEAWRSDRMTENVIVGASRRGIRSVACFLIVAFLGMVALGVWAAYAEVDEISRAQGQVIAEDRTQIVTASEKGVIDQILVAEGQQVEKGQLLVRFEQDRAFAAYDESLNKVAALEASYARLEAEAYGHELVFPASLDPWPEIRQSQKDLYLLRRRALGDRLDTLERSFRLLRSELAIYEQLQETGDVGLAEVLQRRRQLADIDGEIVNVRNRFFEEAQSEFTRVKEELDAQNQLLRERTAVLAYTELRAPMAGVVKKIQITTEGVTVGPGEVLMELVPSDSPLIIEARFSPVDISMLREGMPAKIKLDAYDYSIYGALEGELIYLGADAVLEDAPNGRKQMYFVGRLVVTHIPERIRERNQSSLITGMTASVEVKTRDKTVLSYLTKPITKTFDQALHER